MNDERATAGRSPFIVPRSSFDDPGDARLEDVSRRQQGNHDVSLGREIEEVSGMDEDAALLEQNQGELLVGAGAGQADDGGPAAFGREQLQLGSGGDGAAERLEVLLRAGADRIADARADAQ